MISMETSGRHLFQDNMAEKFTTLLLQIINAKADVNALLKRGVRYSQIAKLIADALSREFIREGEKGFEVTEKGIQKIRADAESGVYRKDGGWITKEEESKIEKIDIYDIYLPSKSNSNFS